MSLLDGRVAVITGSTRGIGREMADGFSAEGARIVINGRNQKDADDVAAALPDALAIGGDMAEQRDVDDLVPRVQATWGSTQRRAPRLVRSPNGTGG
jgi:3-oxoacyl-[acyl-carrier protein] reductase